MTTETAELAGKTFIITGANTGIGKITAMELARKGAHLILACRNSAKTDTVIKEIVKETGNTQVEYIHLDLGDLSSVRECAKELLARDLKIHGLVNNAGLAGQRGLTKDGFEIQFGTNHLGHYLFTRLLLDRIKESGGARIVNVASKSHYAAKGVDWSVLQKPTRSVTAMKEYSVSKLANVLFTKELARRLEGTDVTTYAVHPGVVATDVWRRVPGPFRWVIKKFMLTPEQGAESSLRCATAPELAKETGRYYDVGGKEVKPNRLADDADLAKTLWTKSAEWTGLPA
ncbi:MAG: SDR family oxidoreductase [Deltaproteobacteria bacterium]|nr:SDR family oxidoreductase [Deltaproteobacteria bacterium]MCW5807983.1 SDR family oxidoreductase [Deltaproteobacteria bacterium]